MRILFFSDHFWPEPSAPAAHVFDRARLWVRAGHQVTVMTSAPNFPEGRVYPGYRNRMRTVEDLEGIRVVRVKTLIARNEGFGLRTLDYASYMVSSFAQAWREPRPDVVISTSPHLPAALGGAAFARLRGVPHVAEIRDLWPASIAAATDLERGPVYRMLEAAELWLYRTSARVVPLTRSFADDMARRGVPREKIDVVVNGANLNVFSPRPPDAELLERHGLEGRFVVGYLGTMGLAHGLGNVLDAAERLRAEPVTFLMVGTGAARDGLLAEAGRRGLDNVVFVPRQLREEMPRYWSLCHAGLVHLKPDPVFGSVIPSKIFEAMAMGLPTLYVGPAGEGPELVESEGCGVVVPPADPERLAAAVLRLRDDRVGYAAMAARALAAAPGYSRERQAERTLASLMRATGQGT